MAPWIRQVFASFGPIWLYFSLGFWAAAHMSLFSTPSLPIRPIPLSLNQQSWIGSALWASLISSQVIAGVLTSIGTVGRKGILTISSLSTLFTTVACLSASTSVDFSSLLTTHIFGGIIGSGLAIGPVYISEISSPELRPVLLNLTIVFFVTGLRFGNYLRKFFSWKDLALFGVVPAVFSLIITITTPESPSWLASKGRLKECEQTFFWFRENENEEELSNLIANQKVPRNKLFKYKVNMLSFIKEIAVSVSCIVLIIVGLSSKCFLVDTKDASNSYLVLILDVSVYSSLCMSCITIMKFPRRNLLFACGVPAIVFIYIYCILTYISQKGYLPSYMYWLPNMIIILFCLVINVGVVPVSTALLYEVYSLPNRGFGVIVNSFVCLISVLIFTHIKPSQELCGMLSTVALTFSLYILFAFAPETSKRTMLGIETEMSREIVIIDSSAKHEDIYENMLLK